MGLWPQAFGGADAWALVWGPHSTTLRAVRGFGQSLSHSPNSAPSETPPTGNTPQQPLKYEWAVRIKTGERACLWED